MVNECTEKSYKKVSRVAMFVYTNVTIVVVATHVDTVIKFIMLCVS